MPEIQLTKGYTAIVDDADRDLKTLAWYALITSAPGLVYAKRSQWIDKHTVHLYLHRVIAARVFGDLGARCVDHTDGNGLNNRRENLQLLTVQHNGQKQIRPHPGKTSRFKGVSWDASRRKWAASIRMDGRTNHLGRLGLL